MSAHSYFQVHSVKTRSPKIAKNLNRIRKMVSFGLGKEMEKEVFLSCHEHGTKKKLYLFVFFKLDFIL